MKFWEAMKEMQNGKKVRKADWKEGKYLCLDKEYNIEDEKGHYSKLFCVGDKDDWEIYEEKKDTDEKLKQLFQILNEDNWFANNQYGEYIYDNNLVDHMTSLYIQLIEMAEYYKLD